MCDYDSLTFSITSFLAFVGRYELLDTIGQGTFGVVRKCRNRETGDMFAVKTILKSKVPNLGLLKKEVELLRQVDHPHIIKLYDAYEEPTKLHLITELCTGGT
jgi:serine/threonine protein kinase